MTSLLEIIKVAETKGVAIGHFNFAEITVLQAAAEVAKEMNLPVVMGTSESEREFLGLENAVALIKNYRESGLDIFLNADHTKSLEHALAAAHAGYDAILFDQSHLSLEENIKLTKEAVAAIKKINPDILVEGELGYIGSGSQLREAMPEGIQKVSVDDCVRFAKETGVDLLAPAVGNIHGIIKGGEPNLDIDLIKNIKAAVGVPLVLHGASGNSDSDIKAAIKAGIAMVHISTEVRLAWHRGLEEELKKEPEELAPYKTLAPAEKAAAEIIRKKLELFNS